jgi:hypothetical protein
MHPIFKVWKGLGAIDDSNEEWIEANRAPFGQM